MSNQQRSRIMAFVGEPDIQQIDFPEAPDQAVAYQATVCALIDGKPPVEEQRVIAFVLVPGDKGRLILDQSEYQQPRRDGCPLPLLRRLAYLASKL